MDGCDLITNSGEPNNYETRLYAVRNRVDFGPALWEMLDSGVLDVRHKETRELCGKIRHLQGFYYLYMKIAEPDGKRKDFYSIVNATFLDSGAHYFNFDAEEKEEGEEKDEAD